MTTEEPMTSDLHVPEIHTAIDTALRRRPAHGSQRSSASRRRPSIGRWGALAFATVLVGGTAIAATTTSWVPVIGNDHAGHPAIATGPLPADQADAPLAVLRRPQDEADRGPQVQALLATLPVHEMDGVHVDDIRLLADRSDGATVLIPLARVGAHDPGYASSIRTDQLCLFYTSDVPGAAGQLNWGQFCGSAADLVAGRIGGSSRDATDGHMHQIGLVPDGVATVQLTTRDGATITADVRNNAYDVPLDPGASPVVSRADIHWLDADDNPVPGPQADPGDNG